jgi:hypothetical protein
MSDQALWALRQRVEKMRHGAERHDGAGSDCAIDARQLAADIALQWRQLAEQTQAVAEGSGFDAAKPRRLRLAWSLDPDDQAETPSRARARRRAGKSPK